MTVLAAAAIVAGIFAIGQRNDARDNASLAQANTTAEAEARKDADANAALAEARELAASAINVLDEDPELSILLSLQAIDGTPPGQSQPVEVIDALWQAVQKDRLEAVVETGYHDGVFVALSPDDSVLFVVNGFPAASGFPDVLALQAYSTSDFETLWEYRADVAEFGENGVPDGDRLFLFLHVIPDGDRVSLGLRGVPARFLVLSASDGEILHNVTYPDCAFPVPWGWSPDGTVLAVTGSCPQDDDGSIEAWTEILDGDTFGPLSRTASAPFDGLSFDGSGRLFLRTPSRSVDRPGKPAKGVVG